MPKTEVQHVKAPLARPASLAKVISYDRKTDHGSLLRQARQRTTAKWTVKARADQASSAAMNSAATTANIFSAPLPPV